MLPDGGRVPRGHGSIPFDHEGAVRRQQASLALERKLRGSGRRVPGRARERGCSARLPWQGTELVLSGAEVVPRVGLAVAVARPGHSSGVPSAVPSPARYDDTVSAQPAEREDPLDPQRILDQLPADERGFFLDQYREAVENARDPAGWKQLRRVLRLWRFHADAVGDPGYREALDAARASAAQHLLPRLSA
jgi:Family of unknown function (DUF6247)